MRERPILFSAPMVRAILAGTKTQTRRVVKPRKDRDMGCELAPNELAGEVNGGEYRNAYCEPGDHLWVRETWAPHFMYEGVKPADILIDARSCLFYAADGGITGGCGASQRAKRWRPAIHMPRAASRITLEVTGVRVERLNDISRGDAMAEGCPFPNMADGENPRHWYMQLWEQINGAGSWDANPFVWIVEFRRT